MRQYSLNWPVGGTCKGMNINPFKKKPGEVSYAMNVHLPNFEQAKGYEREGGAVNLLHPVNGLYQYKAPRGSMGDASERMRIVGCDDTTAPDTGGALYKRDASGSGYTKLNGFNYATGPDARYQFVTVNGKLYTINGYSPLIKYYPNDTTPCEEVSPVDSYSGDPLRQCLMSLPRGKTLGQFKGRIALSNFQAGAGPYPTSTGASMYIDKDGPRTTIISEAVTDASDVVSYQVKEFFTFGTNDEQEIVAGPYEFKGQVLYWLTDSLRMLIGDVAGEYRAQTVDPAVGCSAPLTLMEINDSGRSLLIWQYKTGWFTYDGATVKNVTGGLDGIFTQLYGRYSSSPLMFDTANLHTSCGRVVKERKECQFFVPLANVDNMMGLVYNYEEKGWTLLGKACYIGADGLENTDEYGFPATVAIIEEMDNGLDVCVHGDMDGFVNIERADCKVGYQEFVSGEITGTGNATTRITIAGTQSTPPGTDPVYPYMLSDTGNGVYYKATLVILDDRTAAERTAGDWPTGRIEAGTSRTVDLAATLDTDYYINFSTALSQIPVKGALVALYWPMASRIADVLFADNMQQMKRLHKSMVTAMGDHTNTLEYAWAGEPERMNTQMQLNVMDAKRTIAMKGSNPLVPQSFWVKFSGKQIWGRYFGLIMQQSSVTPFMLVGQEIEHSSEGTD